MAKVSVYIDGFNLYHSIDESGRNDLKWISHKALAESFLAKGDELVRVVFFTAVLTWDHEKQKRHRNFIAAQKALGVEVIESNFKKATRHCKVMNRNCKRHEEKQTDVAIAVNMLEDALADACQRQVLISADSDQVPLFKKIREKKPLMELVLAAPPGRETEARELGALATKRSPLTFGRLATCRLPRNVHDANGNVVARMPALYLEGT